MSATDHNGTAPIESKAARTDSPDDSFSLENGTGINEKSLLLKLDLKLLPAVTSLYLLSFLDRSNGLPTSEMIQFRR